jgi:hypothetical protein
MFYVTTPEPLIDNRNESAFVLQISGMPQSITSSPRLEVSVSIPETFFLGWADYQAGRVADMDQALRDEPPPV